jgi:uncharacterized coiled-coil DUF342 family protein
MTKKNEEVMEMAIKELKAKLDDSISKFDHNRAVEKLKLELEEAESIMVNWANKADKHEEAYQKEHSIVVNLDAEVENIREQLRQLKEDYVKVGKENEHLWGLLKIKMEG